MLGRQSSFSQAEFAGVITFRHFLRSTSRFSGLSHGFSRCSSVRVVFFVKDIWDIVLNFDGDSRTIGFGPSWFRFPPSPMEVPPMFNATQTNGQYSGSGFKLEAIRDFKN